MRKKILKTRRGKGIACREKKRGKTYKISNVKLQGGAAMRKKPRGEG